MYEGFPLFLRRPAELDAKSLALLFPKLAVFTHKFSAVQPNGLPEPDYNDGLSEMDGKIVTAFDENHAGVLALVETFGGKRNYYFYISDSANPENIFSVITAR
ncbi:MAG: DUF695 domain-containing protein, partial [Limisphaerales bacterium]